MKAAKLLLTLVVFSLVLATAQAAQIDISAKALDNEIGYDGSASYELTITNNQKFSDQILLKPGVDNWGQFVFDSYALGLGIGETRTTNLKLSPPKNIRRGAYTIDIIARSGDNAAINSVAPIKLIITTELPLIDVSVDLPETLSVGTYNYNVIASNSGHSTISNIQGSVSSSLFDSRAFDIAELKPMQTKVISSGEVEILKTTDAGTYTLNVHAIAGDYILTDKDFSYTITSLGKAVSRRSVNQNWFTTTYSIDLKNTGSSTLTDSWQESVGMIQKTLIVSEPMYSRSEKDKSNAVLYWDFTLAPGESLMITYTLSYNYVVIVLIAVLIIVAVFIVLNQKPFEVIKDIKSNAKTKVLKVTVSIKNSSAFEQKNVILEDIVPPPMKLVKEFGTLEPDAITRAKGQLKITWKFPTLAAGEERIVSYELKSSLAVIGKLKLPPARAKAKINAKSRTVYSNELLLRSNIDVAEKEK